MRDDLIKELISAYVDDELSVDERALVERHLADSVEYQQLLDQFRQQRMALRSLTRYKLKSDFSQRVLQAIEQARPTVSPAISPAAILPQDRLAIRSRWKSWQGVATAIGSVAALLMLAFYLSQPSPNGVVPPYNHLIGDEPLKDPGGPSFPEAVKPPEELRLPKEVGSEEPLSEETLLALREFQKLIQYVVIYDITLSPQAQKDKILEGWMAKAGIPINKGIVIDAKLEKEILGARFIGNDKIGPGQGGKATKQEVEMFFVRGTIAQIDAVGKEFFNGIRAERNPQVHIRLDMAAAPRDLHIFLQLNEAAGLDLTQMRSNPRLLKSPGAFPIQFPKPLYSASSPRLDTEVSLAASTSEVTNKTPAVRLASITDAGRQLALADSELALVQNSLTEPAKSQDARPDDPNSSEQPGQAIFLVRKIKDELK